MADFTHVKVGDTVTRLLAGKIPMRLRVTEVTDVKIIAGIGWEFDRKTGAEIDDDLNWGPPPKVTGSFLVEQDDTSEFVKAAATKTLKDTEW